MLGILSGNNQDVSKCIVLYNCCYLALLPHTIANRFKIITGSCNSCSTAIIKEVDDCNNCNDSDDNCSTLVCHCNKQCPPPDHVCQINRLSCTAPPAATRNEDCSHSCFKENSEWGNDRFVVTTPSPSFKEQLEEEVCSHTRQLVLRGIQNMLTKNAAAVAAENWNNFDRDYKGEDSDSSESTNLEEELKRGFRFVQIDKCYMVRSKS